MSPKRTLPKTLTMGRVRRDAAEGSVPKRAAEEIHQRNLSSCVEAAARGRWRRVSFFLSVFLSFPFLFLLLFLFFLLCPSFRGRERKGGECDPLLGPSRDRLETVPQTVVKIVQTEQTGKNLKRLLI